MFYRDYIWGKDGEKVVEEVVEDEVVALDNENSSVPIPPTLPGSCGTTYLPGVPAFPGSDPLPETPVPLKGIPHPALKVVKQIIRIKVRRERVCSERHY